MNHIDSLGIAYLREFVETADKFGICYNGKDIPTPVQDAVIDIINEYVEEYEVLKHEQRLDKTTQELA